MVRGNIGWSLQNPATGNTVTNGQSIEFDLAKPGTDIRLERFIPVHAETMIRFTALSTFEGSKFKSGEWFAKVKVCDECQEVLTVDLSRFRYMSERLGRMMGPGN